MTIDISMIIPVYNEAENIPFLIKKLTDDLLPFNRSYEVIFIDDGSSDSTFTLLEHIQKEDERIRIIKFRKNYGKSLALNTAFRNVKGEIVITMDGDLQDDSAEIGKFLGKIDEGYDLVCGWKYARNDPLTKTAPSKVFNALTRWVTGIPLHDFNCGFKAYRREVINILHLYGELHRYTPVLVNFYGFKITEIPVRHHPRKFGTSKYGFGRLFKGFLDLITIKFLTSYMSRPLHVFGIPGLVSSIIGLIIGVYLLILKFTQNIALSERPLLLLSILLLLLGLQFLSLGLLGEMITYRSKKEEDTDYFIERIVG